LARSVAKSEVLLGRLSCDPQPDLRLFARM